MPTTAEQTATRPFHETVVARIKRASSADMQCLGELIEQTTIPKGHDEIIAAWNYRRKEMCWGEDDGSFVSGLLAQKQANAEKPNGEKKGVQLGRNSLDSSGAL